jgi:HSP20 family protein
MRGKVILMVKKVLNANKKMPEEDVNENVPMNVNTESKSETDESSELSLDSIIDTIKDKQEEFSQMFRDSTGFNKKTLVDIIETNSSVIIKADMPRLKKEDIEIAISEDSVDICAEFEEETRSEDVKYILRERGYGSIRRSVTLPAKVKIKEAEGTFKNSVLTIKIPKLVKKTLKLKIK